MIPFECRGISKGTRQWVYGYALSEEHLHIILYGDVEIIPETLGVKVGTQDGVDIYVGDRYYSRDLEEIYTVYFDKTHFRAGYEYETTYEMNWEGLDNDDVYIGTIHDHLLKEKKNDK